jgi:hypothetical protein
MQLLPIVLQAIGHSGHGRTYRWLDPVAIDPLLHDSAGPARGLQAWAKV